MLASRRSRAVALLVVLAAMALLPVAYGAGRPVPDRGVYPVNDEFVGEDRYRGTPVVVYGRVVAADPTVVSAPLAPGRRANVTVLDADPPVGARVGAFGPLVGDRRVRARSVLVQSDAGFAYAYLTSALAGLWTLARIRSGWRLAPDGLRPRRADGDTGDTAPAGDDGDTGDTAPEDADADTARDDDATADGPDAGRGAPDDPDRAGGPDPGGGGDRRA